MVGTMPVAHSQERLVGDKQDRALIDRDGLEEFGDPSGHETALSPGDRGSPLSASLLPSAVS